MPPITENATAAPPIDMGLESEIARLERHGRLAVLVVDYPPVNALGRPVKLALAGALASVAADEAIDGLLIRCEGRTFFAGADIKEFGMPPMSPLLPEVIEQIEASRKPVIAAIHGNALGGGLELAMSCTFRVATARAMLGLPEVKLGLLPGAGGTQRLPRLVGVEVALEMLTIGNPIDAPRALELGLIDAVIDGDLAAGAIAYAQRILAEGRIAVPTRDRDDKLAPARADPAMFDRFEQANARKFRGLDAPAAILAAARGVIGDSFEAGLARERELFIELQSGPQAAAMQYMFFAEREAAKIPGLARDIVPLPVESVGIIGAGTMGSGIAINFLLAGLPVTLVETDQAALDRGAASIAATLDRSATSGRITAAAAQRARDLLDATLDFDKLATGDLIIEAAFETMAVKQDIFARLDAIARPEAILATNTSYLDVDAIAAVTARPEQVLGLHFFSPANIMKLLEVVRGAKTSDTVLATALATAKRIGKIPVVAQVAHGFIGNRMLAVRRQHAEEMVLTGASPYAVDRVLEEFGFAMGPFRMGDLAGLDLGWNAETSSGSTIRELLCERGRRGQKTGAGFYDHADGKARPSPEVETLIADFAAAQGIVRREIGDAEILNRLLLPMIDEGARILEEGKAYRASDIDVVWLHGYGWPVWTGGPMFHADRIGLEKVAASLGELGLEPSPLLARLAREGGSFASFDRSRR